MFGPLLSTDGFNSGQSLTNTFFIAQSVERMTIGVVTEVFGSLVQHQKSLSSRQVSQPDILVKRNIFQQHL